MSNPPNPLANFRTYSYHHILIVTDGMKTASELSNSSDLLLFNRPNVHPDARYNARFLDDAGENGYVTLIDGMQDVTFFVESIKWETIVAPSGKSGGSKRASTLEVDGEMTIIEPLGVKFLEVLTNVGSELGTDPSGFIFLLKTIFVGHHHDGRQELISNVRPFLFTMIDVKAVMDASGTTYNLTLVGVNNGTAKLPQISRIADGINLSIPSGASVRVALGLFFDEINKRYAEFKKKLSEQLQAAKSTINVGADFRSVRYEIATDDTYEEYVAADNNTTPESDTPGDAVINCGKNSTIENSIQRIMDSSKQVMDDAAKKNKEEKKFIYKIASTILPDLVGDDMVVQYTVHRYEEITQTSSKPLEPIAGEFIEFDYMFTGRNVDVLEFDIKMDMGMSFFQTVATAASGLGNQTGGSVDNTKVISKSVAKDTVAREVVPGKTPSPQRSVNPLNAAANQPTTTTQAPKQVPKKKIKTPLFLGTTIKDPVIRNKRNPLESATFDALLSRHAAYENVECAMKIAGNPQLLDETTPQPIEVQQGGIQQDGTDNNDDNTGMQKMFTTPALIKVNVKFPDNNELTGVTDFWYKGFYNLYSITQNFDNGLFTQDIQMFSLPIEDDEDTESKLSSSEEETTPTSQASASSDAGLFDADDAGTTFDAYEEPAEFQNFPGDPNPDISP